MSGAQLCAWILFLFAALFPSALRGDVITDWNQQANACVLEAKMFPFAGRG